MKNCNLLLFMLLLCSWSAQATILTVSNNGGIPAQYTDLQIAHNSANPGDTLFVHASGTTYGDVTISKQITIIGDGYSGISTTPLQNITFNNSNATGSSLSGLFITGYIFATTSGAQVDAVSIERCYFYRNGDTSTGFRASSKIISTGNNWIIRNCIVYQTELCNGYGHSGLSYGWIIANNWIYNDNDNHNAFNSSTVTINYLNNPIIENNLFVDTDYVLGNVYSANFKNNILVGSSYIESVYQPSNVLTSNLSDNGMLTSTNGNIQNANPLFINSNTQPSLGALASSNLQLQASSLARGAGVGGTDIGLHGGATPMPFPYDGKAAKPNIEQLIIQNPVVGQGQFLKFQIEAKTRD